MSGSSKRIPFYFDRFDYPYLSCQYLSQSQATKHKKTSQTQPQQRTDRRAPLLLRGLFSSFKWVKDAEASFTRQPQAYFSCQTPAAAAAAPCQQLPLCKGSQLLWVLLTTIPVRAWTHLNLEEASCWAETAGQTEVYVQVYIAACCVQYPRLWVFWQQ